MGRRPARRAPPAVPQAGARLRGDHAEGPHAGHPRRRRLRAADRAHQRRPGRRRRLRGAGARARPDRPASRSVAGGRRPVDKLTVFVPARRRGTGAGRARRGRRRADRRLRLRVVHHAGRGPVPAARRAPTPTIGTRRRDRDRRRGAGRGGPRPRRCAARSSRRCWPRIPTRSRRTTSSSSPTPADPDRHRAGRHRSTRDHAAPSSPRPWPRRCPTTAHGSGWPATPSGRSAGSRCAAAPGDFLLDEVAGSDADVYVTSDLRHHPAAEFVEQRRPGAGRRRALGGRVDLAAGGRGAAAWRRSAIRGHPGERASAPTPGHFRL